MSTVQNAPTFPDPAIAERLQQIQIRSAALQAALQINPTNSADSAVVVSAAKAFEAYLTGTSATPATPG